MKSKFTWGDSIIVKHDAPEPYRYGQYASVCGMRLVSTHSLEKDFGIVTSHPMYIYIIEYADGISIEIPEIYLNLYTNTKP